MNVQPSAQVAPPARDDGSVRAADLSFTTCLGWGLASFVLSVVNNTFNFVLLRYLTDMVGISSAFAGGAVAVAKIVDALVHPAVGTLSDRTVSRWGRRRPYIPLGGALCALAMLATFNLHHLEAIRWAMTFSLVALFVYGVGYAFVVIPTLAMSAEMTSDPAERIRLISIRVYMLGAGQLIGSSFAPMLLSFGGSPGQAYSILSWTISGIAIVGCVACFLMTSRARATLASTHVKLPLRERIRLAAGNKPFMALLAIKLLFWIGVAMTNGMSAYFTKYVLERSDVWLGIYNALKMVGWIASEELWIRIARRKGKRFGFAVAAIAYGLAYCTWLNAGPDATDTGIIARSLLIGVATGGIAFNAQAMLPDTIQYDHYRTGVRREGVFSGLYSLIETAAFSTGVTLIGFLLAWSGYVSGVSATHGHQPASAVTMIHYAYMLTPVAGAILALMLLRFYTLDKSMMDRINAAAATRPIDPAA